VQVAAKEVQRADSRRKFLFAGLAALTAAAILALGWWIGRNGAYSPPPEYQQITFRNGLMDAARFTPDGSVVYSAEWDGGEQQLYLTRSDEHGSRELGMKGATLLAISKAGELAIRLNTLYYRGYARAGTMARVALSGGTPREVLEQVQDADWAPDGENLAVVRYAPENRHWRLEYPVGKVLLDGINWLSSPKISPDGKWVAFSDHQNPMGDDQGTIAVIGPDGKEKILSSGWISIEGIAWSPSGDEIWFSSAKTGSAENLRGVTLSGKLRDITNVPGGMWLQDLRNGVTLAVANQVRLSIRGVAHQSADEVDLGWFGWSGLGDISRDGKFVLFEEEGEGGGPNYTVFLRNMDGSPPVRIGEGRAEAISPDNKWVITQPMQQGSLMVVPTGAGQARALTHDNVRYTTLRYLPDGKQLLAAGIEPGHGARDYLIDVNTGDSKPITPEGTTGVNPSPDGKVTLAIGPDGKYGLWPLDGSGLRPIPGLQPGFVPVGWTPDGSSVYLFQRGGISRLRKIFRLNLASGKTEPWKTLGEAISTGVTNVGGASFAKDTDAYAYSYSQDLSQAYLVRGLK
jgi:Tol biopolymer transport system component